MDFAVNFSESGIARSCRSAGHASSANSGECAPSFAWSRKSGLSVKKKLSSMNDNGIGVVGMKSDGFDK